MHVIYCTCGQRVVGDGPEEVASALRAHVNEAHAHWGIPDAYLRELRATSARMAAWDGQPLRLEGEPEIRRLSPGRLTDFLRFFDRHAFMDNPLWSGCYCMAPHFAGSAEEWVRRSAAQNREEKRELIRSGRTSGYLAYVGGRPVAWCHAAPRSDLPGLGRLDEFRTTDGDRVGAIACFVVSAPYRRQGLARRLLEAACDGFRADGLTIAEAYPPKDATSDARAFRGPLDMYLSAGFRAYHEGKQFIVVRKTLA
jgi:GNAT superfamily N-acetyltransferase